MSRRRSTHRRPRNPVVNALIKNPKRNAGRQRNTKKVQELRRSAVAMRIARLLEEN